MGPELLKAANVAAFDAESRTKAEKAAEVAFEQETEWPLRRSRPLRGAARRFVPTPTFRRDVRHAHDPRGLHREPGPVRMRGLPDAVVPVPQGVRTRRAEHDEPVGRHGDLAGLTPASSSHV